MSMNLLPYIGTHTGEIVIHSKQMPIPLCESANKAQLTGCMWQKLFDILLHHLKYALLYLYLDLCCLMTNLYHKYINIHMLNNTAL